MYFYVLSCVFTWIPISHLVQYVYVIIMKMW